MAISLARAKVLCDSGELALVRASGPREIGAMSAAELRRSETRARKLRDKWRDQSAGQQRKAQAKAGARDAGANRNSAEKAKLFDEVLGRFTAKLAKVEAAGETAGPMGRKRSTRTARSRTHRASRAEVRGELKEAKRGLKAETTTRAAVAAATKAAPKKKKKAAMPAPVVESPMGVAPTERALDEPPATVRPPKRKGKPFAAGASAIEAGRIAQGLHVTKQQQLLASASAKRDRLKASGVIRIQTNRSAANKRQQGRRDSR